MESENIDLQYIVLSLVPISIFLLILSVFIGFFFLCLRFQRKDRPYPLTRAAYATMAFSWGVAAAIVLAVGFSDLFRHGTFEFSGLVISWAAAVFTPGVVCLVLRHFIEKKWAQISAVVFGIIFLIQFPLGTIMQSLVLWELIRDWTQPTEPPLQQNPS